MSQPAGAVAGWEYQLLAALQGVAGRKARGGLATPVQSAAAPDQSWGVEQQCGLPPPGALL